MADTSPESRQKQTQDNGLAAPAASQTQGMSWNDGDYYDMSFGINRSRRYHAKMQDFYQRWADITNFVSAVLGTGAFLVLIGGKDAELAKLLTGVVAIASSLSFTFSPSKKAWVHSELCKGFTDLSAEIYSKDPTTENLKLIATKRLSLESKDFPVRRLVDLVAENEESRARGIDERDLLPLTTWQQTFGYMFTFGMARLEKRLEQRQAALPDNKC